MSRREFLAVSAAISLTPRLLADQNVSSFPGMITRMAEPENLEFPFASLNTFITPNEHFFIRSHFAVPKIDRKAWKLTVEGAVANKLELSYDDLLKFKTESLTATLECAGNGRVYLTPAVPGLQWGQGAVGNAEWTGVPLATILEKAGVKDSAVDVVLEGADKGQINNEPKSPGPIHFARSIPIKKAKDGSVVLAYQMNAAELPASHGFPMRAVVGGWYGMASVKWLTRIIVTEKSYKGFWQTLDYSYWERKDGLPHLLPITNMDVKSSIARPSLNEVIPAGKPYRIFGAAWAGESAIAKVEVSTDGGTTWTAAKFIDNPTKPMTWCLWESTWAVPAKAGLYTLMARATDRNQRTQPLQREPDRRSYMISHIVQVDVVVR